MSLRIIPAIMSGGAGARLWPLSTEDKPKQFHALGGGASSLFTQTAARARGAAGAISFAPPIVLCNARHVALVREHLARAGVTPSAIVSEPIGRNTAAVAAIAAAVTREIDPHALVLLLPSDHLVADEDGFRAAIERAAQYAQERIVTFGVTPDRPATGYGYIKRSVEIGDGVFAVEHFREKPNAETAAAYLAEGGHFWNAGFFLFSPQLALAEFGANSAVRDAALASLSAAQRVGDEIRLEPLLFSQVPALPFDIAVMEKTTRAAIVPCDIGWTDIGAWDEIWRAAARDQDDNTFAGDVTALDVSGMLIRGDGVRVCAAGVRDLIIVATRDAVVVVPRERAQDVKQLLERKP